MQRQEEERLIKYIKNKKKQMHFQGDNRWAVEHGRASLSVYWQE